eukprot:UN01144
MSGHRTDNINRQHSWVSVNLNKESLAASITSAKSSEMNVLVPSDETDGDWVEHPLPQQYYPFFPGRAVHHIPSFSFRRINKSDDIFFFCVWLFDCSMLPLPCFFSKMVVC